MADSSNYGESILVSGYDDGVTEASLKDYFQQLSDVRSVMKLNENSAVVKFVQNQNIAELCRQRFVFRQRLLTVTCFTSVLESIPPPAKKSRSETDVQNVSSEQDMEAEPSTSCNQTLPPPVASSVDGSQPRKIATAISDSALQLDVNTSNGSTVPLNHELFTMSLISDSNVCQQMNTTVQYLQMSDHDIKFRQCVYSTLFRLMNQHFTSFELNLFGSSISGLGFANSDIDIVLTLYPSDYKPVENLKKQRKLLQDIYMKEGRRITLRDLTHVPVIVILNFVKWILCKRRNEFLHPFIIRSKVAPLVKFQLAKSDITCDLSVKHKMAVYNTYFIKLCVAMDPRFKPLMFTIKWWFQQRHSKLASTNRFNSYTLALLVIFFLQNTSPPVFPTVEILQGLGKSVKIGDWNCGFCNDLNIIPSTENKQPADELLKQFFQFYTDFDFGNYIICPSNGVALHKDSVAEDAIFKVAPFCVQDPFELSRNTAGNIAEKSSLYTIREFKRAALLTQSNVFNTRRTNEWGLTLLFLQVDTKKNAAKKLNSSKVQPSSDSSNATSIISHPSSNTVSGHNVMNHSGPALGIREVFLINFPDVNKYPQLQSVVKDRAAPYRYMSDALYNILSVGLNIDCERISANVQPRICRIGNELTSCKRKQAFDNSQTSKKICSADTRSLSSAVLQGSCENTSSSSVSDITENVNCLSSSSNDHPTIHHDSTDGSCSVASTSTSDIQMTKAKPDQAMNCACDNFLCKVAYRFWDNRKRIAKNLEEKSGDPLMLEAQISDALIKQCKIALDPPLLFTVRTKEEGPLCVQVEMITEQVLPVFVGCVFPFLRSLLTRLVPRLCLESH